MLTPPIAGALIGSWLGGIAERGRVGLCDNCDFNIEGVAGNRCPECGEEFEPERLP